MEDLSKTPTVDLIKESTMLEKEINLKILKYNLYIAELVRRFPMLEKEKEFQQKTLEIDKNKEYKII